jgi:hypothetical protein
MIITQVWVMISKLGNKETILKNSNKKLFRQGVSYIFKKTNFQVLAENKLKNAFCDEKCIPFINNTL